MTGGVYLSAGREERAKAARLEASSCGGGDDSAWAGWAGREAEAQWEDGRHGRKKNKNGLWLGRKAGWAGSDGKKFFSE
jgi:hypothetical protein